jgi:hypothetical protein
MTVQACGNEFLATRTLTQASRGNRPHTPGRAYFSASLEMTGGVAVVFDSKPKGLSSNIFVS